MKSVLISIQPKWCELIASGKKTVEVRKTVPKLEPPFKCYIYCTNKKPYLVWGDVFRGNWETEFTHLSGYNRKEAEKIWDIFNGNVIGEFVCDRIDKHSPHFLVVKEDRERVTAGSCLAAQEIRDYVRGNKATYNLADLPDFYCWHISDLVIYDEPKPLTDFVVRHCLWENIRNNGCIDASGERCFDCRLKRPPQSWCYVEG